MKLCQLSQYGRYLCLFMLVVLVYPATLLGKTIEVPQDQRTISDAIEAATNGDVILLSDGIYKGKDNINLSFQGKTISVTSKNGPQNCIIDCEGAGRGFIFDSGESNEAVVSGITIKNGYGLKGGAIYIEDSSPTITNCILTHNESCFDGGAIYFISYFCSTHASPVISFTKIENNVAGVDGGGIYSMADCCAEITLINNIIAYNKACFYGGGIFSYADPCSVLYITNNTISNNQANINGGGIYYYTYAEHLKAPLRVANTLITNNEAVEQGGGIHSCAASSSAMQLMNCDIWGNKPAQVFGDYIGENNLKTDPLYVDSKNHDFHLTAASPVIDAGTLSDLHIDDAAALPVIDYDDLSRPQISGIDIGAYEYPACLELPNCDLITWGCRGDDSFYSLDILDARGRMVLQAIASGEELHSFSPSELDLPCGTYQWKVWSPSVRNYAAYQEGFQGELTIFGDCNNLNYKSTYEEIQWGYQTYDTHYCVDMVDNADYCVDIFDENDNMILQAVQCGTGLHRYSPKELNLPCGTYKWKIWSSSCRNGYGGLGFEGEFKAYGNCTAKTYLSTYDSIEWGRRNDDRFYCIDIFDANWQMIYQSAKCGDDFYQYSPKKELKKLSPGTYNWKVWSPSVVNYGEYQQFYEGFFIVPE